MTTPGHIHTTRSGKTYKLLAVNGATRHRIRWQPFWL